MDVKTYRARTMQEALLLVRRELGPDAAVLHTREVRGGMLRIGRRMIEVTASASVSVPSRLPTFTARYPEPESEYLDDTYVEDTYEPESYDEPETPPMRQPTIVPPKRDIAGLDLELAGKTMTRDDLKGQLNDLHSMVESLCRRTGRRELPDSMFRLFTDLIDADVSEELARELVERLRAESPGSEFLDSDMAKSQLARMIEDEIQVAGPIRVTPGRCHLVALVGPTGVGKTTTIAKLAANYRLKEKHRVGLITVDTYRIAAVEQLRTYADIIDLPMEVVSTPRDMRQAVARLADMDLVLMDTAGRSPRDEVKIQELKSMLAEAAPDEVQLVLSSTASASSLSKTAERFAAVGTTALVLTKLDEASGLGNLLPLVRSSKLPLSYLTHGQNVPDDIEAANSRRLSRILLGMDAGGQW